MGLELLFKDVVLPPVARVRRSFRRDGIVDIRQAVWKPWMLPASLPD